MDSIRHMKKEAIDDAGRLEGTFPSRNAARSHMEKRGYVPMNSGTFFPGIAGIQAEYYRLETAPPSEKEIASLRIVVFPSVPEKRK